MVNGKWRKGVASPEVLEQSSKIKVQRAKSKVQSSKSRVQRAEFKEQCSKSKVKEQSARGDIS
jgi:division protein CdvB (Snf7/Vps24/ESCRT-III family)